MAEILNTNWNEIAVEELDENTNKSTKFCLNKRIKWKYKQKHHILVQSLAGLGIGERIWCWHWEVRIQFWQNFQTSLVLLIPNCTRHRMITYTNYVIN